MNNSKIITTKEKSCFTKLTKSLNRFEKLENVCLNK